MSPSGTTRALRSILPICFVWACGAMASPLAADTFNCNTPSPPNILSEDPANPTENVISLTVAETITDVNVTVDITHDFIDDVTMELQSPSGTIVQLHNMTGTADFIRVTFDDQGVANGTVPFDSNCQVQPAGPGTLADFNGQSTQGDWTLRLLDNFMGGATGILSEWCLETFDSGVTPAVLPVTEVVCTNPTSNGTVELAWTNSQTYTTIDIESGGAVIATLPGTATSFSAASQPIGQVAELTVVPYIGASSPCVTTSCLITPQGTAPDFEACSVPLALVSNGAPPAVDTITVTTDIVLADLQVQVDVSHPFIGDVTMDLAHGPVTVRLHDEVGGPQDRIQTTYWDLGIPNDQQGMNCGCLQMPSGPGTLSDFFGLSSLGAWTMTITDVWNGPINIGEWTSWCVRGYETGSVNQLSCNTTSGSESADLAWLNPQPFDSINVYANGVLETTLPGTASSYSSLVQLIPSTVEYCIEPVLGGVIQAQNCCMVDFFVAPPILSDCSSVTGSGVVEASWTNPVVYDSIQVFVDGALESTLAGDATSYTTSAAMALPATREVCVVGVQGGSNSEGACCNTPVLAMTDLEVCRIPNNVAVNQSVSPVNDVMLVPSNLLIGEAEVLIDISHTFVGDLIIDLTGPNGAVVRLHDEAGSADDDLVAVFSDTGQPNMAPYNCGCFLLPSGPGSLADFANTPALGAWSLRIEDTFPNNIGFLDKWCLRAAAGCQVIPPANVVAVSDGVDVSLSWTNAATYDEVEIERDGLVIATLAGSDTSYIDMSPGLGVREYRVLGVENAQGCGNAGSPVTAGVGITDVIFAGDQGGAVDSPQELALQLFVNGRYPMVIDQFTTDALAAVGPFNMVWMCLGTFPNEHELTAAEATLLAEIHTGDIGLDGTVEEMPTPVYLESADHWAFDPVTVFEDYDGVENFSFGNLSNGNNSLTILNGVDTGLGLDLSSLSNLPYEQDSTGNDFNDRLAPCDINPDAGGADAAIAWRSEEFGNPYDVGVYYQSTIAPVLTQTWEFGGYGGDRTQLANLYVTALSAVVMPSDTFIRGEINEDGSVNVADAITLLSTLFLPNQPPISCPRAADVNDDLSVNIADGIFLLAALFVGGATPVPEPNVLTGCGEDLTTIPLDCVTQNCP